MVLSLPSVNTVGAECIRAFTAWTHADCCIGPADEPCPSTAGPSRRLALSPLGVGGFPRRREHLAGGSRGCCGSGCQAAGTPAILFGPQGAPSHDGCGVRANRIHDCSLGDKHAVVGSTLVVISTHRLHWHGLVRDSQPYDFWAGCALGLVLRWDKRLQPDQCAIWTLRHSGEAPVVPTAWQQRAPAPITGQSRDPSSRAISRVRSGVCQAGRDDQVAVAVRGAAGGTWICGRRRPTDFQVCTLVHRFHGGRRGGLGSRAFDSIVWWIACNREPISEARVRRLVKGTVQGCRWNETTCRAAASRGHLKMLQWCRAQGCLWNSETCRAAAGLSLEREDMRGSSGLERPLGDPAVAPVPGTSRSVARVALGRVRSWVEEAAE